MRIRTDTNGRCDRCRRKLENHGRMTRKERGKRVRYYICPVVKGHAVGEA